MSALTRVKRPILQRLAFFVQSRNFKAGSCSVLYQKTQNALIPEIEMPPCDYEPEPYKGMPFDNAQAVRKSKLGPGLLTYYKNPVYIWKGHMQWLWDSNNKRYLDFFAGIVTVGAGHCHPYVCL